ncbi:MAG: DAK2 domain-containing protein, partial [Clostridiales bacterium]|nr:DAK2 domain-containing protein [Clostridiales bacterium]
YKAVMKPKEGTILTVARGGAEKAAELVDKTDDLVYFADEVIKHMDEVLASTPDMLPVLKEAGVVDSGGQGLLEVLKGAYDAMLGKEVDITIEVSKPVAKSTGSTSSEPVDIKFGYCTEFIVMLEKEYTLNTEKEFKGYLESIGDSIVVVSDDDIVKVHVHTNDPGLAIQRALTYGSLTSMKIDNMREEHQEKLIKESEKLAEQQKAEREKKAEPRKPYGFISVSAGEGLDEIFRGIGADYLIEGGQTMNPSTEDMLNAIDRVNADTVYILPNNKNIILAAEQAKGLVEDKKVVVIPSKTIPQGITAIINFAADLSPEDNERNMIEEMSRVKTGQITYAVRNTVIDDIEIQEGDIMALGDDGILAVGKDIESTVLHSLKSMVEEESELVTIYYGKDVNQDDANVLKEKAEEIFSACEVELHAGGQPIYYYLISVE